MKSTKIIMLLNLIISFLLLMNNLLTYAFRDASYPTPGNRYDEFYYLLINGNKTLPIFLIYFLFSLILIFVLKKK